METKETFFVFFFGEDSQNVAVSLTYGKCGNEKLHVLKYVQKAKVLKVKVLKAKVLKAKVLNVKVQKTKVLKAKVLKKTNELYKRFYKKLS